MAELEGFNLPLGRKLIDFGYRQVVHRILTSGVAKGDREIAHERVLILAEKFQNLPFAMTVFAALFNYSDPILSVKFGSLVLPNPFGVAPGFDKDGRVYRFLGEAQGFGFVTVGTVTTKEYGGNDRARVFDLPANNGLINRMGFPGKGTKDVVERMKRTSERKQGNYGIIASFAASKPSFVTDTVIADYGDAFKQTNDVADASEGNFSSPNTKGVTGLQDPVAFRELSSHLAKIRSEIDPDKEKPLIAKFGPDLPKNQLESLLTILIDNDFDGVVLTNTCGDRSNLSGLIPEPNLQEIGGISGEPLRALALENAHIAHQFAGDQLFILRAGGVRGSAGDLWEAFTYGGATVAEVLTSYVRPNTSTPNFTWYALKDLAVAMRMANMTSMEDFKPLRGKRVSFPL